ncbi:conserved hypothetical protein [Paraburkholderia piptadeniae]|uniref:Uncharacterized protein n=1 Tax=Paraburkholderia piptadeniae TaxID=1701573 RepID=A0A1N7SQT0_9BURK|nr:conserved hypothetical protein [Paraburkholderia piptadeniae]
MDLVQQRFLLFPSKIALMAHAPPSRSIVILAPPHAFLPQHFPQRFKAFKPLAARSMRPLHSPFADHRVGISTYSNQLEHRA